MPVAAPPSQLQILAAVADAGAAADRAAQLAAKACLLTTGVSGAQDDAAEAARAAMRARIAAERAQNAMSASGAWSLARLAWAAETSVEEANARVSSLIVEQLLAV